MAQQHFRTHHTFVVFFIFATFHLFSSSHDFIGEFTTSYKELCRGQGQSNVYEVSGENDRLRSHPFSLLSHDFYLRWELLLHLRSFSRLDSMCSVVADGARREGPWVTYQWCANAPETNSWREIPFWFKSRTVIFDSRSLTSLTFSAMTSLLTYDIT